MFKAATAIAFAALSFSFVAGAVVESAGAHAATIGIVKTDLDLGCTPVGTTKLSDGSVWGIENCQGLEKKYLLGHAG
jgi:hypothetical protein